MANRFDEQAGPVLTGASDEDITYREAACRQAVQRIATPVSRRGTR